MKKSILIAGVVLGLGFMACTKQNDSGEQTQRVKNLISIVEIPAADFSRAGAFYKAILGVKIEEMEMGGLLMGLFVGEEGAVNVAIVKGADYKPTTEGAIVYFNAGDDLQITLDKIVANGGKVIVPKTEIGSEMGFFAQFTDTEGNKLGLYSVH